MARLAERGFWVARVYSPVFAGRFRARWQLPFRLYSGHSAVAPNSIQKSNSSIAQVAPMGPGIPRLSEATLGDQKQRMTRHDHELGDLPESCGVH